MADIVMDNFGPTDVGLSPETPMVSHDTMRKMIYVSWLTPSMMSLIAKPDLAYNDAPLLFYGGSGGGKTQTGEELASELGEPYCHIECAKDGITMGLMQVPFTDANGVMHLMRPVDAMYERILGKGRGVLVFDEVGDLVPAVAAMMHSAFRGKKLGSFVSAGTVRAVGFANPPLISTHPQDLPRAPAGRMGIAYLASPLMTQVSEHRELAFEARYGAKKAPADPNAPTMLAQVEQAILDMWKVKFPTVQAVYRGFAIANNDLLKRTLSPINGPQVQARTCDYAFDALTTCAVLRDIDKARRAADPTADAKVTDEVESALVSAYVGRTVGQSIMNYMTNLKNLPAVDDFLENRKDSAKWRPDPANFDHAVVLAEMCKGRVSTTAHVRALTGLTAWTCDHALEYVGRMVDVIPPALLRAARLSGTETDIVNDMNKIWDRRGMVNPILNGQ